MRKISTLALIVLITGSAGAQIEFGFIAGPQATNTSYLVQGKKQESEFKYGFQAGAVLKVPFENRLYFAPAVFYSMKGYKVTFDRFVYPPGPSAIDNNTTLHTFELAALLQFDFSNKPGHMFFKGGPSLDFQLVGKETFNQSGGAGQVSQDMKFGPAEYGRYSANVLAQIGFETGSGFMVFAQYTYGLASINNADLGPQIRHRVYGISFGKYFNRKKIVIDTKNKE